MSDNLGKIFTTTSILNAYSVYINDLEFVSEDILSLELRFSFNKPFVEGTLSFKDTYGIADTGLFDGTTTIKIYASDVYNERFSRTFRIVSVQNDEYNERFKSYTVQLIDEIYYKLVNTYISKSFTGNPIDAFKAYMKELELDTYLEDNIMTATYDSFDGDNYSFVVPQDRSILEFFLYEFEKQGIRFWQSRKNINVKYVNFSELESIQIKNPDSNALEDIRYTNDTDNTLYGFKIHDFTVSYNQILSSNLELPAKTHYAYNPLTKSMDTTTTNLSDAYNSIKLNDMDMSGLQQTTGKRFDTDADVFLGEQQLNIENVYIKNNIVDIVVPGNFKYNIVGNLADVRLKGNLIMKSSNLEGDVFHSGKYVIVGVSDRYAGDKLVQKLSLRRLDFQKVRKNRS